MNLSKLEARQRQIRNLKIRNRLATLRLVLCTSLRGRLTLELESLRAQVTTEPSQDPRARR